MIDKCKFCDGELEGVSSYPDMEEQNGAYTEIYECQNCGARYSVYMRPAPVRIEPSEQRIEISLPTESIIALLRQYEIEYGVVIKPNALKAVLRKFIIDQTPTLYKTIKWGEKSIRNNIDSLNKNIEANKYVNLPTNIYEEKVCKLEYVLNHDFYNDVDSDK